MFNEIYAGKQENLPFNFVLHKPLTGGLLLPQRQRSFPSSGSLTQLVFSILAQSACVEQSLARTIEEKNVSAINKLNYSFFLYKESNTALKVLPY